MMNLRIAALATALCLASPSALSQSLRERPNVASQCDGQIAASRALKLDDMLPFAGASHQSTMSVNVDASNCVIIAFYRLPPHLPGVTPATNGVELHRLQAAHKSARVEPAFYARRIADNQKGEFVSVWGSGITCPAIGPALRGLEGVASPRFGGPGPYRESNEHVSDMPIYRLWAAGQMHPGDDPLYEHNLSITSSGKASPLSDWFVKTEMALAPCWSPTPPVGLADPNR